MRVRFACLARVSLPLCLALFVAVAVLGSSCRTVETASGPEQVCMANMKQILSAIRMYLDDNGNNLPPVSVSRQTKAYFDRAPGRRARETEGAQQEGKNGTLGAPRPRGTILPVGGCHRASQANPYLRWPVILDPYLDDRAVWRCPEARLESTASFINGAPDWLGNLQENEGKWGSGTGLCIVESWPLGWGGEVTDSISQGRLASGSPRDHGQTAAGAFAQSIVVNSRLGRDRQWRKADPARLVICADGGAQSNAVGTGLLAYPDICALECANDTCGWADWEECTWAADCGLYNNAPADGSFLVNPELRRPYSRHRGGVNIGFLDGHVEWFDSEELLSLSPTKERPGKLLGYGPFGPTADCRDPDDEVVPTLY